MDHRQKSIEERLREAAYLAVGLGVITYHASRPQREKLKLLAREAIERYDDCSRQWRSTSRKV